MPGTQKKWVSFVLQPQATSLANGSNCCNISINTIIIIIIIYKHNNLGIQFLEVSLKSFWWNKLALQENRVWIQKQYSSEKKQTCTLPKFNSSPLKKGWLEDDPFLLGRNFSDANIQTSGLNSIMSPLPKGHRSKSLLITSWLWAPDPSKKFM